MEKRVDLKVADIRYDNGVLSVDSTGVSRYGKHYDVTVILRDGVLIVKGMKPQWGMSLSKNSFSIDDITEDSIITTNHKLFGWKWTTRVSDIIVEFNDTRYKRELKMYSSNNWILEGDALQSLLDTSNVPL